MEIVTDPILRLHLTGGSNSSMFNEHKFSKSLTIKDLKDKLEIIMGVTSISMKLQVCFITSVFNILNIYNNVNLIVQKESAFFSNFRVHTLRLNNFSGNDSSNT